MDDLLPLLLLAIMYLGPAVWRRIMSKKQRQMQVPQQVIIPEFEIFHEESPLESEDYSIDSPMPVVSQVESIKTIAEETSPWQGKLTESVVINGVIFAEVLQPPRAYRPFISRMK